MINKHFFIALVIAAVIVYLPSVTIFFSADDWFHLRVAQISSVSEFLNFFSFTKTSQAIAFYRPLSTQVFFFVFQKLFGLNPLPYHVFVLGAFGLALYLIFQLGQRLLNSKSNALLAVFIYGFSVSNFTRLYFLSAFQEISLVVFACLSLLNYLHGRRGRSLIFFVLALLSKETAVVLPLVIIALDWVRKKVSLKQLAPYFLILLPYLFLRLFIFGGVSGETYVWNFSPLKAGNTLMWYFLWSLGAPELLIDYIGSGLRPIPRFFTDYPAWWLTILGLLLTNLGLLFYLVIRQIKKIDRFLLACGALFIISLLPVLFLPQHKFALELGLPLIWFALGTARLLRKKRMLLTLFLFFYLSLNLSMNYLTYTRHYSVGRAKVAKKVFEYFDKHYPQEPEGFYFEFINDTNNYGASWGSSKQISNSIGGSELLRVRYRNPSYQVYFEDYPTPRPLGKQKIPLSTKMFLR